MSNTIANPTASVLCGISDENSAYVANATAQTCTTGRIVDAEAPWSTGTGGQALVYGDQLRAALGDTWIADAPWPHIGWQGACFPAWACHDSCRRLVLSGHHAIPSIDACLERIAGSLLDAASFCDEVK